MIETINHSLCVCLFICLFVCSDARTLIDHARVETQNHRFTFDEVFYLLVESRYICIYCFCIGCYVYMPVCDYWNIRSLDFMMT